MSYTLPYVCFCSVSPHSKAIPYGPSEREDGDFNHGFTPYKGRPDDVSKIAETESDPALADFLRAVNHKDTPFFSVGCVSSQSKTDQGISFSGYAEVCFNYPTLAREPLQLFQLFWMFTDLLRHEKFAESVSIHWQLERAAFVDRGETYGVTCVLTINTGRMESEALAYAVWSNTFRVLSKVFGDRTPVTGLTEEPLY